MQSFDDCGCDQLAPCHIAWIVDRSDSTALAVLTPVNQDCLSIVRHDLSQSQRETPIESRVS
jgi:hypothetical protein